MARLSRLPSAAAGTNPVATILTVKPGPFGGFEVSSRMFYPDPADGPVAQAFAQNIAWEGAPWLVAAYPGSKVIGTTRVDGAPVQAAAPPPPPGGEGEAGAGPAEAPVNFQAAGSRVFVLRRKLLKASGREGMEGDRRGRPRSSLLACCSLVACPLLPYPALTPLPALPLLLPAARGRRRAARGAGALWLGPGGEGSPRHVPRRGPLRGRQPACHG